MRPKKKEYEEGSAESLQGMADEFRYSGYNQCIDDFNKFLPDEIEIAHIIAGTKKGEWGAYTEKDYKTAKAIYERIFGETKEQNKSLTF